MSRAALGWRFWLTTLAALAGRMGLDQSTLSRTLRTLETEGLVEIAVAEGDQRKRMVWLTEMGARRLEAALLSWRQAHAELGRLLSPNLARHLALEAEKLRPTLPCSTAAPPGSRHPRPSLS